MRRKRNRKTLQFSKSTTPTPKFFLAVNSDFNILRLKYDHKTAPAQNPVDYFSDWRNQKKIYKQRDAFSLPLKNYSANIFTISLIFGWANYSANIFTISLIFDRPIKYSANIFTISLIFGQADHSANIFTISLIFAQTNHSANIFTISLIFRWDLFPPKGYRCHK